MTDLPTFDPDADFRTSSLQEVGDVGPYDLHVVAAEEHSGTWDAFLGKLPRAPYQQSSVWARVKAGQGWHSARITITRNGSINGGAQLLYKSIPLAGAVGFVTRGPVLTSDDRTLAATAAEGLERLAIACSVTYLIVQTPTTTRRSWRPNCCGRATGPHPRSWRRTTPRRVRWI